MSKATEPRSIGAVERVSTIISILEQERRVGVSELADRLDLSKGTVSTYLSTLAREGYVVKKDGQYALSMRFLRLGETVKNRVTLYDTIRGEVDKLAEKSGERAQFATEEQGKAVIIYLAEGEDAITPSFGIGDYDYLHCIGNGKAMLAQLPRERQREIVDTHGLPKFTENTITDPDALFEELDRIQERGYAIDDEERVPGIRCIAVPIMNDDEPLGSISVSGPATRMTDDHIQTEMEEKITQIANVIEVNSRLS